MILTFDDALAGVFQTSADDFSNGDDIYDAIGGILHDIASDRSEDDIKQVFCPIHDDYTTFIVE